MYLNEIDEKDVIILDCEMKGGHRWFVAEKIMSDLNASGIPLLSLSCTQATTGSYTNFVRTILVLGKRGIHVFHNFHLEVGSAGHLTITSMEPAEEMQRRSEMRFNVPSPALARIPAESNHFMPIDIKDISASGVAFYMMREACITPGDTIEFVLVNNKEQMSAIEIGNLENSRAIVVRMQNGDYGRILIGAKFVKEESC